MSSCTVTLKTVSSKAFSSKAVPARRLVAVAGLWLLSAAAQLFASSQLCIHASEVLVGTQVLPHQTVMISDGRITDIQPWAPEHRNQCEQLVTETGLLAPGLIDIHIHGAGGFDVMEAATKEQAVATIGRTLLQEGVTGWLPTTASAPVAELVDIVAAVARHAAVQPADEAGILGLHMEGPFISQAKKGCHHADSLREISLAELEQWQVNADSLLKIITFAPELPGSGQLIQWCLDNGVLPSIGHTAASEEEVSLAISQGAAMATHLYNGMSMPQSRNAGAAFTVLDSRLPIEVIVDGLHLSPVMVRHAWQLSRSHPERFILISDAMKAKGIAEPSDTYVLGRDIETIVRDGKVVLKSDGKTHAGSILTLPRAVAQLMRITGCSTEDALLAASRNPAMALNLNDRGLILPGYIADMVLFSNSRDLQVLSTWRGGRRVYIAHLP